MGSFQGFYTEVFGVKVDEKKLMPTRSPFILALLYFRGHGRNDATSVHTSAAKKEEKGAVNGCHKSFIKCKRCEVRTIPGSQPISWVFMT
jgi:hypothetical protein